MNWDQIHLLVIWILALVLPWTYIRQIYRLFYITHYTLRVAIRHLFPLCLFRLFQWLQWWCELLMTHLCQCAELFWHYLIWLPDNSLRKAKQVWICLCPQVRDEETQSWRGQGACARSRRGMWIHLTYILILKNMLYWVLITLVPLLKNTSSNKQFCFQSSSQERVLFFMLWLSYHPRKEVEWSYSLVWIKHYKFWCKKVTERSVIPREFAQCYWLDIDNIRFCIFSHSNHLASPFESC